MKINWKAIPDAFNVAKKVIVRNRSSILVGLGIGGWVATAVLVAKAAPRAETAVNQRKREIFEDLDAEQQEELEDFRNVKLPLVEHFKLTWKYYILSGAVGAASTGVICYGHKIDLDEIVKLGGAYKLAKDGYDKLAGKIIEKDGEKKYEEYKRDIREDTLIENPPLESGIYNTGNGTTKFYFPPTERYFYSDVFHVEKALLNMLDCCSEDGTYNLAELADDLGIPHPKLLDNFAVYYESVRHFNRNNIHNMLKPTFKDPDNGDKNVVIWIDIEDYIYNVCDVPDDHSGGIFRYR